MPDIPSTLIRSRIQAIIHLCPGTPTDDGRPVFKIIWNETTDTSKAISYILKAEFIGPAGMKIESADFAFGLTRTVARGARGRALDAAETNLVWELLASDKTDKSGRDYAKEMQRGGPSDRKMFTWVVMGFKQGLTDLSKVMEKKDIQANIALLACLKEKENLQRLGAMLATDLFLNNEDRFKTRSHETGIQNFGNIFFVEKGSGMFKLKALDPWDAKRGENVLLDQLMSQPTPAPNVKKDFASWTGLMLADDAEMLRVATNACDSLNEQLTDPLQAAGYTDSVLKKLTLDKNDAKKVVEAMKATRDQIRKYCKVRLTGRGGAVLSPGIQQRMQLLNWA